MMYQTLIDEIRALREDMSRRFDRLETEQENFRGSAGLPPKCQIEYFAYALETGALICFEVSKMDRLSKTSLAQWRNFTRLVLSLILYTLVVVVRSKS